VWIPLKKLTYTLLAACLLISQCSVMYPIALAAAPGYSVLDYPENWCLDFDGINDSVTCGKSNVFNLDYFTIEAWIKPKYNVHAGSDAAYGHTWGCIIHHRPTTDPQYHGWFIGFNYQDGNLYLLCGFPTYPASVQFHANRPVWYNYTWYHIAVTYDRGLPTGNVKFIVDGALDSQHDQNRRIDYDYDATTHIGRHCLNDHAFGGLIDEVRVWNYSRTLTEIGNTLNRTLSGAEASNSNLVAYWQFDESSGLIANDSSVQPNDGILGPAAQSVPAWFWPGADIIPEYSYLSVTLAIVSLGSLLCISLVRRKPRKLNGTSA